MHSEGPGIMMLQYLILTHSRMVLIESTSSCGKAPIYQIQSWTVRLDITMLTALSHKPNILSRILLSCMHEAMHISWTDNTNEHLTNCHVYMRVELGICQSVENV